MANELIDLLLRINLALAAGIALALALRMPVRRWFGARAAYALWLLPVAAAAMCFAPARVEHIVIDASIAALPTSSSPAPVEPPYLVWAWGAGALVSLIVLLFRQVRFTHALGRLHTRADLGDGVRGAESAAHGPAVIGVIRPVIVTPADFDARFDAEEQRIVLAHERAHLAQGDPWINALVVLAQCVNWFNPLVHIGARALRIDQELACDAAVLAQAEGLRRRYAETILKTHIAQAAPIGCAWPPSSVNDIKERIAMLKRNLPSRAQRLVGASAIALVTAGVAAAAWAAQPARVVATLAAPAPAYAAQDDVEHELDGGRHERRHEHRELTPEERAELDEAMEEVREAMVEMQAEIEAAHAARHAALADIDHEEIARSVAEAQRAAAHVDHEAIARTVAEAMRTAELAVGEAEESRRLAALEAMREVEVELAEVRVELADNAEMRAEIAEAVREAQREIEIEMPRIQAEIREALLEAEQEIAEERDEARARGDEREARELERALQNLQQQRERNERENRP